MSDYIGGGTASARRNTRTSGNTIMIFRKLTEDIPSGCAQAWRPTDGGHLSMAPRMISRQHKRPMAMATEVTRSHQPCSAFRTTRMRQRLLSTAWRQDHRDLLPGSMEKKSKRQRINWGLRVSDITVNPRQAKHPTAGRHYRQLRFQQRHLHSPESGCRLHASAGGAHRAREGRFRHMSRSQERENQQRQLR